MALFIEIDVFDLSIVTNLKFLFLYLEAKYVGFKCCNFRFVCSFSESFSYLDERIDILTQKCIEELKSQGFEE